MTDFTPGTVIVSVNNDGSVRKGVRYIVADPVRTRSGKLRLRNVHGKITATWWTPQSLRSSGYKVETP